jgi:hypothetical protein
MALSEDDPFLVEALEVFDRGGYQYRLRLGGSMVWVASKYGKRYAFYPTTGRWAPYGTKGKHYRSDGAQDFIDRFVKPYDEKKSLVESHVKSQLESLLPESFDCSVLEFLDYSFEMFESGKTSKQVFNDLEQNLKSKSYESLRGV